MVGVGFDSGKNIDVAVAAVVHDTVAIVVVLVDVIVLELVVVPAGYVPMGSLLKKSIFRLIVKKNKTYCLVMVA